MFGLVFWMGCNDSPRNSIKTLLPPSDESFDPSQLLSQENQEPKFLSQKGEFTNISRAVFLSRLESFGRFAVEPPNLKEQGVGFKGRVLHDGKPVVGARVLAFAASESVTTYSGENGEFTIEWMGEMLDENSCEALVEHKGLLTSSFSVKLSSLDDCQEMEIPLQKGLPITISVVEDGSLKAIPGVDVIASSYDSNQYHSQLVSAAKTNSKGDAHLSVPGLGEYLLEIRPNKVCGFGERKILSLRSRQIKEKIQLIASRYATKVKLQIYDGSTGSSIERGSYIVIDLASQLDQWNDSNSWRGESLTHWESFDGGATSLRWTPSSPKCIVVTSNGYEAQALIFLTNPEKAHTVYLFPMAGMPARARANGKPLEGPNFVTFMYSPILRQVPTDYYGWSSLFKSTGIVVEEKWIIKDAIDCQIPIRRYNSIYSSVSGCNTVAFKIETNSTYCEEFEWVESEDFEGDDTLSIIDCNVVFDE